MGEKAMHAAAIAATKCLQRSALPWFEFNSLNGVTCNRSMHTEIEAVEEEFKRPIVSDVGDRNIF